MKKLITQIIIWLVGGIFILLWVASRAFDHTDRWNDAAQATLAEASRLSSDSAIYAIHDARSLVEGAREASLEAHSVVQMATWLLIVTVALCLLLWLYNRHFHIVAPDFNRLAPWLRSRRNPHLDGS